MRLTALLILACLAGCASQPQAPQTKVAEATPAPAASAEQAQPAQQAQPQSADKQFKPPNGYRVKKLGANTVYCKKDTILGSRFVEEYCFTEEQLKELERRGEIERQSKQQQSGMCVGALCGTQ